MKNMFWVANACRWTSYAEMMGSPHASGGAPLSMKDITELRRTSPVHFVVADCGERPQWIAPRESYRFWKTEAQPYLPAFTSKTSPAPTHILATRWGEDAGLPIVVLEKQH